MKKVDLMRHHYNLMADVQTKTVRTNGKQPFHSAQGDTYVRTQHFQYQRSL